MMLSRWLKSFRAIRSRKSQIRRRIRQKGPVQAEQLESRRLLTVGDLLSTLSPTEQIPQDVVAQGASVAANDKYFVVGKPNADGFDLANAGAVDVFDAATRSHLLTINNPTPDAGDKFGSAIAVDGDLLVIGAAADDTDAGDAGIAYVYDLAGDAQVPMHTLMNPAPLSGDRFGSSVDIDGNRIVVGAYLDRILDPSTGNSYISAGSAYVFDLDQGSANLSATLNSSAPTDSGRFGESVAVSGDRVLIGAYGEQSSSGVAHLYDLSVSTIAPIDSFQSDTPGSGDYFGAAVALEGTTAVVSARQEDTGANNAGSVFVFDVSTGNAIQTTHIESPVATFGHLFGTALSLRGDSLVVGAQYSRVGGAYSVGTAYAFDLSGGSASLLATIDNPTQAQDDFFSSSIAQNGSSIIVGAYGDDTLAANAGNTYIFDVADINAGSVPLSGELNHPTYATNSNDYFGSDVSVSGDRLAVGARGDDTGARDSGAVQVYDLSGVSPALSEVVFNPVPASDAAFGSQVAMDGDTLVVAAGGVNVGGVTTGAVYVFDMSGLSANLVRTLSNPNPTAGDYFGQSLSMSGDIVVVGAPREDTAAVNAGSAYVYDLSTGSSDPVHSIRNPTPAQNDFFGSKVSVDGNTIVIGAPTDKIAGESAGSVYVFDITGGVVSNSLAIPNPEPDNNDNFGDAVDVSGTNVVIGAWQDDNTRNNTGRAFVYDVSGSTPQLTQILTNPIANNSGHYGQSVAIEGSSIVIGDPDDRTGATRSGRAFLYELTGNTVTLSSSLANPTEEFADNFGWAVAVESDRVIVGARLDDAGGENAGAAHIFQGIDTNTPPVAQDDTVTTDEDVPVVIDVLADNGQGADFDADGNLDASKTVAIGSATHGAVTDLGNGRFRYTPNADFFGSDSFSYQITDHSGAVDSALVSLTIHPVNDAAVPDPGPWLFVDEGGTVTLPIPTGSDVEGDSFTLAWDLDGDGVYGEEGDEAERGDESGTTPTFDATELNGTSTQFVYLRAVESGGLTGTASTSITIRNVAPDITSIGSPADETLEEYEWAGLTREVTFSDPGVGDAHTATIDYGDGSDLQRIQISDGQRSVILDHLYAITPNGISTYTVSVAIADEEAQDTASFDVTVKDAAITAPDQRPTINFSQPSYVVTEGEGNIALIQAELSAPATRRLEVPLSLTEITAEREVDFYLEDTSFVFDVGQQSAVLTFTGINDVLDEASIETALLAFEPILAGVIVGSSAQIELQVVDNDDPPEVFFGTTRGTYAEGQEYDLAVNLTAESESDVIVTLDLSASASPDLTLADTTLVIPAGSRSATTTIQVFDDSIPELAEGYGISISSVVGAEFRKNAALPTRHSATIPRNDYIDVNLSALAAVTEGDPLPVIVSLSETATRNYTIPLAYRSGTASPASDYDASQTNVVILAGNKSVSFLLDIKDDSIAESKERFTIQLGRQLPSGVAAGGVTSRAVTITDDDIARIQFDPAQAKSLYRTGLFEGESTSLRLQTGGVTFAQQVTVPIRMVAVSKSAVVTGTNADVIISSGSVIFEPNSTEATVTLTARDDSVTREGIEYVRIELADISHVPDAEFGDSKSVKLRINDNDPLAFITDNKVSVSEAHNNVRDPIVFRVRLTARTNRTVLIPFGVYGTAKRDIDYTIQETITAGYKVFRNHVVINAGYTEARIVVKVKSDTVIESNERAGIRLTTKQGGVLLSNASLGATDAASFKINNDDGSPAPRFNSIRSRAPGSSSYSSKSTWVTEGGSFRITVTLPKKVSRTLLIPIRFPSASGRARSNDFTTSGLTSSGQLKIYAGRTSASFDIHTTNDRRAEVGEKIRVDMKDPTDLNGKKYGNAPSKPYVFVGICASDQPAPGVTSAGPTATGTGSLAISGTENIYVPPQTEPGPSSDPVTPLPVGSNTGTVLIKGFNLNGVRDGGTVFLDGNFNGIPDFLDLDHDGIQSDDEPSEPSATSHPDGSLVIEIPPEFDRNGNEIIDPDEAQLVSYGGRDISTGLIDETRLIAAPGDYLTTPLTTLSAKLVQRHGFELEDAHERVFDTFGLTEFELGREAAPHAALDGDLPAAASYPVTLALSNTTTVVGSYLNGVSGTDFTTLAELVYEHLADTAAQSDSTLDLTDPLFLKNLIYDVGRLNGIATIDSDASAVADRLAAINAEILGVPVDTSQAFLQSLVRRKVVARGDMTTDAGDVGRGTVPAASFVDRYSGQNLADRIGAATPGTIVPVGIAISDAQVVEGDDGTAFAEFFIAVSDHFDKPIWVQYATEDDSAVSGNAGAAADYHSKTETLTWNPGDDPVRTIRIPVIGDTDPELDETFLVNLQSASGGLIQRAIGRGYIRADDTFVVDLPNTTGNNVAEITLNGDEIYIDQDGELILDGTLHPTARLIVRTAPGATTAVNVSTEEQPPQERVIRVESLDPGNSLYFENSEASASQHTLVHQQGGAFLSGNLSVEYEGFGQASDERSPILSFSGEPQRDMQFTVTATLSPFVDNEDALLTWELLHNGQSVGSADGASATFRPNGFGEFELRFTAELNDGSTSTVRHPFAFLNQIPDVQIVSVSSPRTEGQPIVVTGTSTDPDGDDTNLSYAWSVTQTTAEGTTTTDFMTGTGPNWSFVPNDNGSYEILLTVTDEQGGTNTTSQLISVGNSLPGFAGLSSDGESPSTVSEIDEVSVSGSYFDAGSRDAHTVFVDWGDGSDPDNDGQVGENLSQVDPQQADFAGKHRFDDSGVYTVVVRIADDDMLANFANGMSGIDFVQQSVVVTVKNLDPQANPDQVTVLESGPAYTITPLTNDTDPAGSFDPLALVEIDTTATLGLVNLTQIAGEVTYDPNGRFEFLAIGEIAIDTFTYAISDGDGGTAIGTVTVTVEGENDAPIATFGGSVGDETDDQDQYFDWSVSDIDGDLETVQVEVTKDGQRIDSLSGPVAATGRVDLNDQGVGVYEVALTATDIHGATANVNRAVTVSDDDSTAPLIEIGGSRGTELEIDDNRFSWSIHDDSGLSALSVSITRDSGDGPEIIYSSTDLSDATGAVDFNDYGIGVYEILVVATDGDADWAGDASGSSTGRTAVVGELFVSTSTRSRLNVDGDEWVTLHRADMTGTSSGDVLFDHSELSHPWFSWWSPNLDAFHMLADGSMILSTDGRGSVGGQDFRDGGLVQFFGDKWLQRNPDNPGGLHQTARMIATEEQIFGARSHRSGIDAISIAPNGDLVVSLDRGRQLADGRSYRSGDLVRLSLRQGGSLAASSLYFDSSVLNTTGRKLFGWLWSDKEVNVNGAHVLEDGRILLTVSRTATVGDDEARFEDGDVFVFDPTTGTARLLWDESSFRRNEDVDALFVGIGNGTLNLLD